MAKQQFFWSDIETQEIKRIYEIESIENIKAAFPTKPWVAIKGKASGLGLKLSRINRIGDLTPLLSNTPECFYWLGFLCADAHFSSVGSIQLELSNKDLEHIKAFCNYVSCPEQFITNRSRTIFNGQYQMCSVSISHKEIVDELKARYNIVGKKSKHPVNITSLSDNQLLCFFIGFIDGDGSICFRKDNSIITSIEIDESWIEVLNLFKKMLVRLDINQKANVILYTRKDTNQSFARWQTANKQTHKKLKEFAINNNLPIMKRKWYKHDILLNE